MTYNGEQSYSAIGLDLVVEMYACEVENARISILNVNILVRVLQAPRDFLIFIR